MAIGAEWHLLIKRGADALAGATVDLTVNDHRINQYAAILDDGIVNDLNYSGLGIDGDHCSVGGIRKCTGVAQRFVAGDNLETTRVDVVGQILRLQVPSSSDFCDGDAAAGTDDTTVSKVNVGFIDL